MFHKNLPPVLIVAVSVAVITPVVLAAREHTGEFRTLMEQGAEALRRNRLGQAEELYSRAVQTEPDSPDAHNQLGLCYSRANRLPEAAGEFRKALEIDGEFLPSLNNMGSVMYRQSDYDMAITYYTKALDGNNKDLEEVETNLGSVYRDRATYSNDSNRTADYEEAVKHYRNAIRHNPNFAPAHNNLGLCYLNMKKLNEAEKEVRQAIVLQKKYATAFYNLGLILETKGDKTGALEAYRCSYNQETVPEYKESTRLKMQSLGDVRHQAADHFARGYELLTHKKWPEAESELRQSVAGKWKTYPSAWNDLGLALAQQGKYREAVQAYQKAIQLLPARFPAAHYNMAQALRLSGDKQGARRAYEKALEQAKPGPHALANNGLGIILSQMGDTKKALACYKMALLQSADTLPVVHYNLGLLLQKSGDKDGAADEFNTYLAKVPNGSQAQSARQALHNLTGK